MATSKRRLPTDPRARSIEMVRRSAASPLAPPTGLPPDLDQVVRQCERDRSVIYAQLEDVLDRASRLADDIEQSGIVVDVVDFDDEDSLVQSVDDLQAGIAAGLSH